MQLNRHPLGKNRLNVESSNQGGMGRRAHYHKKGAASANRDTPRVGVEATGMDHQTGGLLERVGPESAESPVPPSEGNEGDHVIHDLKV